MEKKWDYGTTTKTHPAGEVAVVVRHNIYYINLTVKFTFWTFNCDYIEPPKVHRNRAEGKTKRTCVLSIVYVPFSRCMSQRSLSLRCVHSYNNTSICSPPMYNCL